MKKGAKIVFIVFILFFVTFLGLHFINRAPSDLKIETAIEYTVADEINVKGMSVKSEQILDKKIDGTVCYVIEDGSKVAANQLIGYIYANEQDALNTKKLIEIQKELDILKDATSNTTLVSSQYDVLTKQVNQSIIDINQLSANGDLTDFKNIKNQYLVSSSRREIAVDNSVDFSQTIKKLESMKTECESQIKSKPKSVFSPNSGYFISRVDGFEKIVNLQNIDSVDSNIIEECFNTKVDSSAYIGKLASNFVDNYIWQFVGEVSSKEAENLTEGKKLQIKFSYLSSSEIPVTVEKVYKDAANNEKSIVVLSCDYMNSEIAKIHCQDASLVLKEYTGLKIPKSAMRFKDNEKGVYVKHNNAMYFKKINVVFENDSIIIAEFNDSSDGFLKLYDDVIIEGADLYDGKPM